MFIVTKPKDGTASVVRRPRQVIAALEADDTVQAWALELVTDEDGDSYPQIGEKVFITKGREVATVQEYDLVTESSIEPLGTHRVQKDK